MTGLAAGAQILMTGIDPVTAGTYMSSSEAHLYHTTPILTIVILWYIGKFLWFKQVNNLENFFELKGQPKKGIGKLDWQPINVINEGQVIVRHMI